MTGAQFGQAMPIHRRRVVIPDTGVPGMLDHRVRRFFIDFAENITDRGGAEAKRRDFEINSSKFHLG